VLRKFNSVLIRARRATTKARVRLGCKFLDAHVFEFWGRYSDTAHREMPPLGDTWLDRASKQFETLKAMGLKPHHSFLDYGCAYLATACYVIPYLNPGCYVGVDVAKYAALRGVKRLSERGVPRENYHIATIASPELQELSGFSFDFIFAFSSLQYVTKADFPILLRRFDALLKPGGRLCFDYAEAPSDELVKKGMTFHALDDYCLPYERELWGNFAILRKPSGAAAVRAMDHQSA
jgi:SAM-dependent methyltransferase